ncbi:hypothetical protein M9Y10_043399 [Tritrichomonas musculus]|uniref:ribonuclease H n=1 Tax=Tritrichomonas musculus TaxID=1915356 RepID=A0ABR2JZK5_9EUKA
MSLTQMGILEFKKKLRNDEPFIAYTDGACRGNPGPGGWGAVLIQDKYYTQMSGYSAQTTNNKMEMQASIEVLSFIPLNSKISITTDSKYLKQGIQEWIQNWKRNGWKLKNGGHVKNAEQWQKLDELVTNRNVNWGWVKGHNGDPLNELADNLATSAITARRGISINDTNQNHEVPVSSLTLLPRTPQKIRNKQLNQTFKSVHLVEFLQHHDKIDVTYIYIGISCKGNPGPGAWAAIIQQNGLEVQLSESERVTSKYRLEMKAIISAISSLPERSVIHLTVDSDFVRNGITKWIQNWKKNGWKTANNTDVKNQDLWQKIDNLNTVYPIHWDWIQQGTDDHPQNERCIKFATKIIPKVTQK